jgi:hypothetical protein
MRKPIKYVEKAVTVAAKGAWVVFDRLNRIKPNPSPTPKWSDKPLLKSSLHRFALPEVCARNPPADSRRQTAA